MAEALRTANVDVVGDLADLVPAHDEGPDTGEGGGQGAGQGGGQGAALDDALLLEVALECLALVSERGAQVWWKQAEQRQARRGETGDLSARARGLGFRARRGLARWADRSSTGSALMRLYLRIRGR